jgi:hypothetical protein
LHVLRRRLPDHMVLSHVSADPDSGRIWANI